MIITIWKSDTCKCVADNTNKKLLVKCQAHNTFAEAWKTSQDKSWSLGKGHHFTEEETAILVGEKKIMKDKSTRSTEEEAKYNKLMELTKLKLG